MNKDAADARGSRGSDERGRGGPRRADGGAGAGSRPFGAGSADREPRGGSDRGGRSTGAGASRGGDRPLRPAGERSERPYRPSSGNARPVYRATDERPSQRSRWEDHGSDRGEARGADRPSRPAGQSPDRGYRPAGERGERPNRPAGQGGDRPFRPAGDRPDRASRPAFGSRPPFRSNDDRADPRGGDRPYRPADERPARSAQSQGRAPYRSDEERRPERPRWGDRDESRTERPPAHDRAPRTDRALPPARDRSERPGDDRTGRDDRTGWRSDNRPPTHDHTGRTPRTSGDRPERPRTGERTGRPERTSQPGSRDSRERPGSSPRGYSSAPGREPDAIDHRLTRKPEADREVAPEIDEDVSFSDLDRAVRARLRTLSKDNADGVGQHLVMVGRLLDSNPELAYQHAQAAVRRAGRVDVVREAAGLAAYRTKRFAEALRELRTVRRLNGSSEHLAIMADCERGLGRPERALALAASEEASGLGTDAAIELAIVVSGARLDLHEPEAAHAALAEAALARIGVVTGIVAVRVALARAVALEALGRPEDAAAAVAGFSAAELAEAGGDSTEDDDEVVVFDLDDEEAPDDAAPDDAAPGAEDRA